MSYNKTTWQTGDIVTAEKLNNIENGIASGGGGLKIAVTYDEATDTYSLDKTYAEIKEAINKGIVPVVLQEAGGATDVAYIDLFGEPSQDSQAKLAERNAKGGSNPDGYFVNVALPIDLMFVSDTADGTLTTESQTTE